MDISFQIKFLEFYKLHDRKSRIINKHVDNCYRSNNNTIYIDKS